MHPLPRPGSTLPKVKPGRSIWRCSGGATIAADPNGATKQANGQPGVGQNGQPGSDADVYVDISGNDGRGYKHGYPMWLVLAHELTSGHTTHMVAGTVERERSREEYETIVCEHAHLPDHPPLARRNPNRIRKKLTPEEGVPPYKAPEHEPDAIHEEE